MVTLNYRKIEPTDNPVLEQIIKKVMTEFGAVGQGYSIEDAEVKAMYDAYANPKSIYYVVEIDGEVSGGGGIGPLIGANPEVCELKKMYYQKCYLETVERMKLANQLYQKFGFEKASGSLGNTGHTGCDTYYIKDLV